MEFYAAMKKNEMLSFAGKWMELENIILSEVSLAQKSTFKFKTSFINREIKPIIKSSNSLDKVLITISIYRMSTNQ
jgi:hypothetical protein